MIPRFYEFYSLSGRELSDRDWTQLIRALRNTLPPSFRRLSSHSEPLPPAIGQLARFVPAVDAYTLTVDAKTLRLEHPELNTWLIEATQKNLISRQVVCIDASRVSALLIPVVSRDRQSFCALFLRVSREQDESSSREGRTCCGKRAESL